uniref:Uncharacterized protein n=1 Tax=Megaselia scalaris TaxID=36166 RepID=T1GKB7_MEGSC
MPDQSITLRKILEKNHELQVDTHHLLINSRQAYHQDLMEIALRLRKSEEIRFEALMAVVQKIVEKFWMNINRVE